ncbi:MAG: OadG family transporter subunit [Eubacteriales bacterium]
MNLLSVFLTETAVVTEGVTETLTNSAANAAEAAADKVPVSNAFTVVMGIGTVFIGLICIILLIKLMSVVLSSSGATQTASSAPAAAAAPAAPAAADPAPAVSGTIENRAELIAAVCAAAAEEMGTDVSALRVVSFKKIS